MILLGAALSAEQKNLFSIDQGMDVLDVQPKQISNILARPKMKFDKEYSEERKKIRKYIRKDDLKTKKMGGQIDWGYLLNAADGFQLTGNLQQEPINTLVDGVHTRSNQIYTKKEEEIKGKLLE